jgi:hypothetical protein
MPYVRSPYAKAALRNGFTLTSPTGAIFVVLPNQYANLQQIVGDWVKHPEMQEKYLQSWKNCLEKESHILTTALTRHLTGHIDKKTKRSVFTIASWQVTGINLP